MQKLKLVVGLLCLIIFHTFAYNCNIVQYVSMSFLYEAFFILVKMISNEASNEASTSSSVHKSVSRLLQRFSQPLCYNIEQKGTLNMLIC